MTQSTSDADRIAIVVGTGPAIGGATALALAATGATVICVDRDADAAAGSARALTDAGHSAGFRVADVTDPAGVAEFVESIAAEYGRIDALVNVVGASRWSLIVDTSEKEWDDVFAVNLRQQWLVARAVLPHMTKSGGGSIVAIASVSGHAGSPRHAAYGAAKAGLINLVQTIAVEHGRDGIRANAVSPGTIDTPARPGDGALAALVPLGRRGRPEEIAAAAAFLASDAASYISGQVLTVDGGVSVKHSLIALDEV